jgi:hypothetical protein
VSVTSRLAYLLGPGSFRLCASSYQSPCSGDRYPQWGPPNSSPLASGACAKVDTLVPERLNATAYLLGTVSLRLCASSFQSPCSGDRYPQWGPPNSSPLASGACAKVDTLVPERPNATAYLLGTVSLRLCASSFQSPCSGDRFLKWAPPRSSSSLSGKCAKVNTLVRVTSRPAYLLGSISFRLCASSYPSPCSGVRFLPWAPPSSPALACDACAKVGTLV